MLLFFFFQKIVLTSSFRNAILKLQILSPGKFTLDILNFHSAQKQTSAANKRLSKKNPWHTKRISVRQQYMKDFFYLFLKSWKKEHLSWVCSMNKRNSVRFSSFHLPPMQMASMFLYRTSLLVCIIQMHYGFQNWTLGPPNTIHKKASRPVIQGRLPNAFCRKPIWKRK